MHWLAILLPPLLGGPGVGHGSRPVRARGVATTFWPGDGSSGPRLGCVRAARRLLGTHDHLEDLEIVAMRPGEGPGCGRRVWVENLRTGLHGTGVQLDTGPWGCRLRDGRRVVLGPGRCGPLGGRRLALIDLSRRVARATGSDGHDEVLLRW